MMQSFQVPEQIDEDILAPPPPPDFEPVPDGPTTYEKVRSSSQRGKDKLIDIMDIPSLIAKPMLLETCCGDAVFKIKLLPVLPVSHKQEIPSPRVVSLIATNPTRRCNNCEGVQRS